MKTDGTDSAMTQLQTINECLRVLSSVYPAHSIGKPGVPSKTTYTNVRFAIFSFFQPQIKTFYEHDYNFK